MWDMTGQGSVLSFSPREELQKNTNKGCITYKKTELFKKMHVLKWNNIKHCTFYSCSAIFMKGANNSVVMDAGLRNQHKFLVRLKVPKAQFNQTAKIIQAPNLKIGFISIWSTHCLAGLCRHVDGMHLCT